MRVLGTGTRAGRLMEDDNGVVPCPVRSAVRNVEPGLSSTPSSILLLLGFCLSRGWVAAAGGWEENLMTTQSCALCCL